MTPDNPIASHELRTTGILPMVQLRSPRPRGEVMGSESPASKWQSRARAQAGPRAQGCPPHKPAAGECGLEGNPMFRTLQKRSRAYSKLTRHKLHGKSFCHWGDAVNLFSWFRKVSEGLKSQMEVGASSSYSVGP